MSPSKGNFVRVEYKPNIHQQIQTRYVQIQTKPVPPSCHFSIDSTTIPDDKDFELAVDLYGDLSLVHVKEWYCMNEKSENCITESGLDLAFLHKGVVKAPISLLSKSQKLTVELSLNYTSR